MVDAALQSFADPLGDVDGGPILRMDEADDAVFLQDGEGIGESGPCALGSVAMPPPAPRQDPGELEAGPAFRRGETDHSEERAALSVLHRPHAGAPDLPVPQEEGHVPPGPA